MRYSICDQVLRAGIEVEEGVGLVQKLALLVPIRPSLTSTAHHGLRYDPATLHGRQVDNIEALRHWNSICAIAFHDDSIFSVEFEVVFLVEYIQRDYLAVVAGNLELLGLKLVPHDRWTE